MGFGARVRVRSKGYGLGLGVGVRGMPPPISVSERSRRFLVATVPLPPSSIGEDQSPIRAGVSHRIGIRGMHVWRGCRLRLMAKGRAKICLALVSSKALSVSANSLLSHSKTKNAVCG